MSDPERWMIGWTAKVCIPDGEWIKYEDYAKLKAENERLRKAGDAMDAYLKRQDGTTNGMLDCRFEWLNAKGVQSSEEKDIIDNETWWRENEKYREEREKEAKAKGVQS